MSEAGQATFNSGIAFGGGLTTASGVNLNIFSGDGSASSTINLGTSSATRLHIDNDGNIGIGTTSPNYTLGVHKAAASSNYMQITNSDTGSGSGDGFLIGVASDEAATIWNQENTRMVFGTNGTERMRIASDGNIGIGTTDAGNAKLVLNGAISSGADTAMIDFDGFGTYGADSSQSINFRMGRTGQATDQAAQIRSIFQGGGATAGQTSVGFEFRPVTNDTVATTVRFSGTGQRIQFNTDEIPQSANPITNQAIVIGPSSSGAITQGLTNATVLQNRSGELYAVDSSHNNTQLTPHNWGLISSGPSEELAWTYYSQRPNPSNNEQLQTINVDMAKVVRKVEDLVGEKLIYTENSDKDGHTFQNIISDIQTTLADLKTRVETLEG